MPSSKHAPVYYCSQIDTQLSTTVLLGRTLNKAASRVDLNHLLEVLQQVEAIIEQVDETHAYKSNS
eukprot:scaffold814_cov100-Cylindrotheca_fusiformis.AAC.9